MATTAVGCGGISLDGYAPLSCTGNEPDMVGALGQDVEADYIALFAREDFGDPETPAELVQSVG